MRWTVLPSPVGDLTVARTDAGIAGVWFADHRGGVSETLADSDRDGSGAAFGDVREQLGEYFDGRRTTFDLPLAPRGDAFARRVWDALREIPYGTTWSYGDIARRLGGIGHSQAVGVANGRNPISIVVPCHRVVGHDGALVGYAGGLWRKRFLLDLEEPSADEGGRLF
ncbi:methylated-DNA--[protein]-cysteine S-methyltransferase [Kineococcus sp. SYSU DK003]|uniref:methylated-DNA--[protein]-cysteine S-methyltransferase n=1 Tax=Kineococcus sp. SYSU DK003 TaxID=3383124 RepID=UPI003D7E0226